MPVWYIAKLLDDTVLDNHREIGQLAFAHELKKRKKQEKALVG